MDLRPYTEVNGNNGLVFYPDDYQYTRQYLRDNAPLLQMILIRAAPLKEPPYFSGLTM